MSILEPLYTTTTTTTTSTSRIHFSSGKSVRKHWGHGAGGVGHACAERAASPLRQADPPRGDDGAARGSAPCARGQPRPRLSGQLWPGLSSKLAVPMAPRQYLVIGGGMTEFGVGQSAAARATARPRRSGKSRKGGWRERLTAQRRASPKAKVGGRRGRRRDAATRAQVGCPESGRSARKQLG